MTKLLTVTNISKVFDTEEEKITVLKEVSFEVEENSLNVIIGPSGCGKSTLLRIIAGLTPQTSGQIIWHNSENDSTTSHNKISFVFQNFALFPFLTVWDNIDFGLKMNGAKKSDRQEIVKNLIEEMGLSGFEDKHPKELSGGMKQRVGIARALAIDPHLLLMDEPFSSLDEFTAESLREILLQIFEKRKITIVMVTHLISEAIELSDQIIVLTPSPGSVEKTLENSLPHPRNSRSEGFFKMEDKLKELIKF